MYKRQVKAKWAEEGRTSREKGTLFHALKEEEDINCKDKPVYFSETKDCLLYTSDAADERSSVDLGGRRIIKKKQ